MTALSRSDIFKAGDLLNNTYRIESILGRGGTSEVYKARSEISGRVMAVKALRVEFASNDDFLSLMTREENIRDVRHDAIVRYFDTQRMANGVVYLVMEYVEGPSLDFKLKNGGMAASELMFVGQRITEGLIAAHSRNIVHRDLSPDNIILRGDSPADAVIIDFGIAKDSNPGAETIVGNEFAGKYAYAAPEQLGGNTDARSDIYSLGALLLSTFRGEKPDIGTNPMEILKNKGEPLIVQGVPEPLRGLILKMSHPDPTQRFQSAQELLAVFKDPNILGALSQATQPVMDDATVMASAIMVAKPTPKDRDTNSSPLHQKMIPSELPPELKVKRKHSPFVIILCVVLFSLIGVGAYISGSLDKFFGPKYPLAEPFSINIQRGEDGFTRAIGFVPSPEVKLALSDLIEDLQGKVDLTLATGSVADTWGSGVVQIVRDTASLLDEFDISVFDETVSITGLAGNSEKKLAFEYAFDDGFPTGFFGKTKIKLGPRVLPVAQLEELLDNHIDCGRPKLFSPPVSGYGLQDRIIVTGRFAETASRDALQVAISDLAGERPVRIEADILNSPLCLIDAAFNKSKSGGFDVRLGFGKRLGENSTGIYIVGDNPVIDVAMPELIQSGYLYVSVVDVKGVVFHMLPNRTRRDNAIETLKSEAKDGFVRVAYSISEATENGRLAFTVDDSVLGKSRVIVLYSDQPLFGELRPTSESTESYVEALEAVSVKGELSVRSVDTGLITTKR